MARGQIWESRSTEKKGCAVWWQNVGRILDHMGSRLLWPNLWVVNAERERPCVEVFSIWTPHYRDIVPSAIEHCRPLEPPVGSGVLQGRVHCTVCICVVRVCKVEGQISVGRLPALGVSAIQWVATIRSRQQEPTRMQRFSAWVCTITDTIALA